MVRYIVNPAITEDIDYYRNDDHLVEDTLNGGKFLFIGLRRIGKTSFLYKVSRVAKKRDQKSLYFLLGDIARPSASEKAIAQILEKKKAIILLDEAEALVRWTEAKRRYLFEACQDKTVVMSCAPLFFLDFSMQPQDIQEFLETFEDHHIGPLSRKEAFNLLIQKKRGRNENLSEETINRILDQHERIPVILQALGQEASGGQPWQSTLSRVGSRILSGLNEKTKKLIRAAARGEQLEMSDEVQSLILWGALRSEKGRIVIASEMLSNILSEIVIESSDEPWELYAQILHLSDLHFGPKNIEPQYPPSYQLERLTHVLEEDKIVPDFVAVTGDYSWSGKPSELKLAEEFLEGLVLWLSKKKKWVDRKCRQRIQLVPGNHEASWLLTDGTIAQLKDRRLSSPKMKLIERDAERWISYSLAPYANFVNRFYRGDIIWDLDCPIVYSAFKKPSICFLNMSTCHFITKNQDKGAFGDLVIKRAIQILDDSEEATNARLRIGLWHHNLRSHKGVAITDVHSALSKFIERHPRLDLALHGHTHKGQLGTYIPPKGNSFLCYSSAGSFGVVTEWRDGDETHGWDSCEFAIINILTKGSHNKVSTRFYRLSLDHLDEWKWRFDREEESDIF